MRTDNAKTKRAELHIHSKMSDMDGVTSAAVLIEQAFEWGHGAIAITDSGNVCAYPEIMNAVERIRKNGGDIKPIYGMEANLVIESGDMSELPVYCISILVKNMTGLKNLYKLVSLSNLNYFHKVPRIPLSELEKHREGLIIGSGYDLREELCEFYDYYEICPGESEEVGRKVAELADKYGKLCVATGNVHYKDKEDEIIYKVLRSACGSKDAGLPPMFFRTTDEMLSEFQYLGEEKAFEVVVTNTNKIAGMIDDIRPIPRGSFAPAVKNAERDIVEICGDRAREMYGGDLPRPAAERLNRELRLIIKQDHAGYYMIMQRFVKYSEENGYHTGARGAVGSSFAAFLLGITDVNPLPPHYRCPKCRHSEFFTDGSVASGYDLPKKSCPECGADMTGAGHDIPYETLMGLHGEKEPDIDLNFSGEIQESVHRYAAEMFGKDRVFRAGVIQTVREATARGFVQEYCDEHGVSFDEAETERLTEGCVGVRRASSCHPGGLLVIPEGCEVSDFTPVQYPGIGDDIASTQIDFHALHDTLTKFDILGHDVLTLYKRLEDMTGIKIPGVPMNDPRVYELFTSAEPLGISDDAKEFFKTGALGLPEFGTNFVTQMLIEAQPKTFSELVKISALAHGTNAWIDNADELIKSGVCTLPDVIAARDDVFLYLTRRGVDRELAYEIAEITRKGMARRLFDGEIYQAFEDHDVPDWFVESCHKIMYIFPKAHAAAYVTSAVKLAWFKLHRPSEFYVAVLSKYTDNIGAETVRNGREAVRARIEELLTKKCTPREGNELDMLRLVFELMSRGLEVLAPDIFRSEAELCTVEDGKIRLPLCAVRGVGHNAAVKIREAVENGCASLEEIQQKSGVSSEIFKLLTDR